MLMAFLKNALMCIKKKLHHYCINALVYNAVYKAYLSNAVCCFFNAVCLHNAYFFAIDLCKCFLFSCFVLGY